MLFRIYAIPQCLWIYGRRKIIKRNEPRRYEEHEEGREEEGRKKTIENYISLGLTLCDSAPLREINSYSPKTKVVCFYCLFNIFIGQITAFASRIRE